MIFGLRILPLTMMMALLMLAVKVTDLVRGGEELSSRLLVAPVVAETKPAEEGAPPAHDAEAKAEEKPAEPAKKEEHAATEEHAAPKEEHGSSEHGTDEHGAPKKEKKDKDAPPLENKGTIAAQKPEGTNERRFTPAELDLLQNLSKRRAELDKWEQNVQLKENLLSASEMRINEKLEQLDVLKKELTVLLAEYNKQEDSKVGSLVKIYENMKPADAGRIFEEMDMPVLLEVVDRMSEKKAAPILANMTPLKAKQLTQELAQRRKTANNRLNAVSKAVAPSPGANPSSAAAPTPSAPVASPPATPAPAAKPAEPAPAAAAPPPAVNLPAAAPKSEAENPATVPAPKP